MVRIRPIAAIRPVPSLAARVASVPYDVVSRDEAAALAEDNPYSFLHVIRAEIDLPDADPYESAVYRRAGENLRHLLREGVMIREPEPHLYVYRLVMDGRSQVGLVGGFHVEDYRQDVIRKHERTRPEKEDDRTRHVLALGAHAGPVFLTHRDDARLDELVRHEMNARPLYHFVASDGVTHTVWAVRDAAAYVAALAGHDCIYVADGHHRIASAARASTERRRANPDHRGDETYNWFLGALFPTSQLRILPYNRFVRDLGGLTGGELLDRLAAIGTVTATAEPAPPAPLSFGVYLDGRWHRLELDPASVDGADPVACLDVALLQDRVLGPVLGITDPRTDRRIEFVGGIRGTEELERRVGAHPGSVAFAMHPTSIEQLLAVADAGLFMPPKSTWFEPKLRSGLFVLELDEPAATPATTG